MNVLLFLSLSDKAGIVDLISMIMNCNHVSKLVDTVDVGGISNIGFLLCCGVSFSIDATGVEGWGVKWMPLQLFAEHLLDLCVAPAQSSLSACPRAFVKPRKINS